MRIFKGEKKMIRQIILDVITDNEDKMPNLISFCGIPHVDLRNPIGWEYFCNELKKEVYHEL